MNREKTLAELQGGLWHTTHPKRFESILREGAILPDPPQVSELDRHGTRIGPEGYPYVRSLGGVSLFDFADFEPASYEARYPVSSWAYFVPYHLEWKCAVWIEIDRELVKTNLILGADLLTTWRNENAYIRRIMPEIEAAHIGPLPVSAFKRAFSVRADDDILRPLSICRTAQK